MPTVAVVEDNADSRLLVAAILEERYAVRAYASGAEALAAFAADPPDVVLLDISLPGMDGTAVLARLRADADARLRAVPVIAFTAYARDGDRARYLAAGFDGYVAKPIVDETHLLRTLADCLARG
jgi:CheY-like chemotaxis protein